MKLSSLLHIGRSIKYRLDKRRTDFGSPVVLMMIIELWDRFSKWHISVRTVPKLKGDFNFSVSREKEKSDADVAMVIQGPVVGKDDFTYNSIRFYKQIFPDVKIILSTWDTEDKNTIKRIKTLGIEVLLNKMPEEQGFAHINCQIKSMSEGIKYAREMGGG